MPLLKKKEFEKAPLPQDLKDDDEVFYCNITNEVFTDYGEFADRMLLCNSMVWTCSVTGKTNMTYVEALESEKNARKLLKEFPADLKVPILCLAMMTKRRGFGDLAEDIFLYAKERYFIGEIVETCFTSNKWKDSRVVQVIAPTEEQLKSTPKNGNTGDNLFHPPASSFKYEIEHQDAEDSDISEVMIIDFTQIRHKRRLFNREKCKLFLKQHVEQNEKGNWAVKQSTVENFGLAKITFRDIFDGPEPDFSIRKAISTGKKMKQESLHKFLTKNGNKIPIEPSFKNTNNLVKSVHKKPKEDPVDKQKKKEESQMLAGYLKQWNKPKEDLELEDQQKLPNFVPVKTNIPDRYVGDVLMIMEFVHSFSKLLAAKDFFPSGLTFEIMESCLMTKEMDGPLLDLINMFLSTLFFLQEEESAQYDTKIDEIYIKLDKIDQHNVSLQQATRLATVATRWSKQHHGAPLSKLSISSFTVTEILRLHLLSSGARINETGAKSRYQLRGGYFSEDDPGLYLRMHQPHILKALAIHHVAELPTNDKIKLITCLMDQMLTYSEFRSVVEERVEKRKQDRLDLKVLQLTEKKRNEEYRTARWKLKREAKNNPMQEDELKELEVEAERRKMDNECKINELTKTSYENQVLLGQDRAFRQYWNLESVPGVFVNFEEENPGTCYAETARYHPELFNANDKAILDYIMRTPEETNSSDKENSPSKSPKKVNGILNVHQEPQVSTDLLMCSADPTTCIVHSSSISRTRWSLMADNETLCDCIKGLNKRGIRENELLVNLKSNKEYLERLIAETPIRTFNDQVEDGKRALRPTIKIKDDSNANPTEALHDFLANELLELEKKLHEGSLATLAVSRDRWRTALQTKNYTDFDRSLTKRHTQDSDNSRQSSPTESESSVKNYDPGNFLNPTLDCSLNESAMNSNDILLSQTEDTSEIIRCLSIALYQLANSVEPKYLKRPLGHADKPKHKYLGKDILGAWEQSLLASTSFSQIILHMNVLESSVMWSKSILQIRCRYCKRGDGTKTILLCDDCNLGQHLSCLRPPLKKVPPGDWYCPKCVTERRKREKQQEKEEQKTPRRRPIFRDEEIDEDDNEEMSESEDSDGSRKEVDEGVEMKEEEDEETSFIEVKLCKTCGSGGEVIICDTCSACYHIECVSPPLRRIPRGPWGCSNCKKKRTSEKRYYKNGAVVQRTGVINGQRRCAAKALFKIHDFARSLRQQSSDSDDSSSEEVMNKRSNRRDEVRDDLPLHNVALHELLAEVMKHPNSWPFLRPVQKNEVPDYYDVITKPMDFGTIKYKLNMGEYHEDAQLMSDAVLVFQNCNTYNHTEDDVYKCGVELLKVFQNKCRELGLKLPDEMDYNSDAPRPKKKRRN